MKKNHPIFNLIVNNYAVSLIVMPLGLLLSMGMGALQASVLPVFTEILKVYIQLTAVSLIVLLFVRRPMVSAVQENRQVRNSV